MDERRDSNEPDERRSRCAERTQEARGRQLSALSPLERIVLALRLGARDAAIQRKFARAAFSGL